MRFEALEFPARLEAVKLRQPEGLVPTPEAEAVVVRQRDGRGHPEAQPQPDEQRVCVRISKHVVAAASAGSSRLGCC